MASAGEGASVNEMSESVASSTTDGRVEKAAGGVPSPEELARALTELVGADGVVPAGVAGALRAARGWTGRVVDVLEVLTEDVERMGYLAGGRRPDEVATWVGLWADSALTLEQIRLVVAAGGWDPDPFVVLARAGLLEAALEQPDGSLRRVRGELAGGYVSDELALADDAEILRVVRAVIAAAEEATGDAAGG